MPMSVFRQAQEERYTVFLLEEHQLVEGHIYGERASEEATAAMAAVNPNFVAKQQTLYEATHAQTAGRNTQAAQPDVEAALAAQAITDENAASYTS